MKIIRGSRGQRNGRILYFLFFSFCLREESQIFKEGPDHFHLIVSLHTNLEVQVEASSTN